MDLNWVKLNGFKRFEEATLNTSGKIIALLGANEAGKSSLLQALPLLNHDNPFNQDLHLTRNKEFNNEDIILEAGFLLNDDDRKAISHLYQSELIRWLYIKKPVSGKRQFEIKPLLPKDIRYRNQVLDILNRIKFTENSIINKALNDDNDQSQSSIIEQCKNFINQLKESIDKDTNLSPTLQTSLKRFSDDIFPNFKNLSKKEEITEYLKDSIDKLLEYERGTDPNHQAIEIFKERIPKFLLFDELNRDLKSDFNLASLNQTKPNKALYNLLKIAKIDIEKLSQIFNNPTQLKSTVNKANRKIQELYEGKWSQSEVKPVLDVNGSILRVFIENEQLDTFDLHQRSDGLRQFVALINFLEVEHAEQPILLVDEAELHLHYDAQADLIEIFTQQKFASKIIYTTHSVGCLPEDLGTGVKLVCPLENVEERSTIENHFWSADQRPGVLPLLFGMGASQLAFMAIRQSVFVEGSTDMLLLPTLLRQAAQINHLGFQIVQGVAMTAKANFGLLENHAPKVTFLVDNDKEGANYKKQLKSSGIGEERIFQLPEWGKATVLEDYIRKELYLEAVNEQIKNWNEGDIENFLMSLEDIPDDNRPKAVKDWCEKHNFKYPEKISITYYLLDLATGERQEKLIDDSLQSSLVELYNKIIQVFS